jgi:hypothetical protein
MHWLPHSKTRLAALLFGGVTTLAMAAYLAFRWWPPPAPSGPVPQPGRVVAPTEQPDPVKEALARDQTRLLQYRESLPQFNSRDFVARESRDLVREFDAPEIWENQAGPVDRFFRDDAFLALEALLHGPSPVQIQIRELMVQAQLLQSGADAAMRLTAELETPEAMRVLGDSLWSDAPLRACARQDAQVYAIIARTASDWAPLAVRAIADKKEKDAIEDLRVAYATSFQRELAGFSVSSENPLVAALPTTLSLQRDRSYNDRGRAHAQAKARAQVAAIALRALAENRVKVLQTLDGVAAKLNASTAISFMDSFSGFKGLPKAAWDAMSDGTKKMVNDRLKQYVLNPAGVEEAQRQIRSRYTELPAVIKARITDEADHDDRIDVPKVIQGHLDGGQGPAVDEERIRKELVIDCMLVVADVAATATEVAVIAGLAAAPEPVVTKMLAVAGVIVFAADMTWEAMKAYPKWQRKAGMRLSSAESVCGIWIGTPPHQRVELDAGTVVTPGSTGHDGAMLIAELDMWRALRRGVEAAVGR